MKRARKKMTPEAMAKLKEDVAHYNKQVFNGEFIFETGGLTALLVLRRFIEKHEGTHFPPDKIAEGTWFAAVIYHTVQGAARYVPLPEQTERTPGDMIVAPNILPRHAWKWRLKKGHNPRVYDGD